MNDTLIKDNLDYETFRFTMGRHRSKQYYSDVDIRYKRIVKKTTKSTLFELITENNKIYRLWIPVSFYTILVRRKKIQVDGWMAHLKNQEYIKSQGETK